MFQLFKKKVAKTTKLIKCATVYISDKHRHIIITPSYENNAGIIYEQEKGFTADYPIDITAMGMALVDNLNFYSKKDLNLRGHKKTDWPSFKQSRSKSVTAFENEYIQILIRSVNNSNLILTITGMPFKTSELSVNSTISFHADKQELGQRIKDVYEACLTGKLF